MWQLFTIYVIVYSHYLESRHIYNVCQYSATIYISFATIRLLLHFLC
jgi:hypothetical protein